MRILLVEDSAGDVRLIREAFKEANLRTEIVVVEDGEKALAYLRREPPYTDATFVPHLIILDLNLPKVDGKQVLAVVKNDRDLRSIPVIVLSSSRSDEDVSGSYDRYANCYIPKPLSFDGYVRVAKGIEHFWLNVVSLPVVHHNRGRAARS